MKHKVLLIFLFVFACMNLKAEVITVGDSGISVDLFLGGMVKNVPSKYKAVYNQTKWDVLDGIFFSGITGQLSYNGTKRMFLTCEGADKNTSRIKSIQFYTPDFRFVGTYPKIQIGDPVSKVLKINGVKEIKGDAEKTYEVARYDDKYVVFYINKGKVTSFKIYQK